MKNKKKMVFIDVNGGIFSKEDWQEAEIVGSRQEQDENRIYTVYYLVKTASGELVERRRVYLKQ